MDSSNDPPLGHSPVLIIPQIVASTVLIIIGVYAAIESFDLGIGTLTHPGAGFAGLLMGTLLVVPSLFVLGGAILAGMRQKDRESPRSAPTGTLLNQAFVLVSMAIYIYLIPRTGYLFATFLFASAVIFLSLWRGWTGPLLAGAISIGSYIVFSVLLNVPLAF